MDTLGATIGSLFNVVRLFVLFDLISSGSRKNDNLWKSLGGIMVNGAPREVPRVLNAHWGSHLIETPGNKVTYMHKMIVFEETNDENLNVLMLFSLGT